MESSNLRVFTSDDLKALTGELNKMNLIGTTQSGKLYRGRTEAGCDITVKIWDEGSDLCMVKVSCLLFVCFFEMELIILSCEVGSLCRKKCSFYHIQPLKVIPAWWN